MQLISLRKVHGRRSISATDIAIAYEILGGSLGRIGGLETSKSDIGEKRQLVDFEIGIMLYKPGLAKIRLSALDGQITCEPSI